MSYSMDHAEALFSLFARNNPIVEHRIPQEIRKRKHPPYQDEDIITIHDDDVENFLRKFEVGSPIKMQSYLHPCIHLIRSKRSDVENFGALKQIIPVACIHDSTRVLLLELVKPTRYVDGYNTGTLTYPQGHACYTDFAERLKTQEIGQRSLWSPSAVDQILRQEIFREINEEITVQSEYHRMRFMYDVGDILFRGNGAAPVFPIYVNRAGTTSRHIAMIYDIDMTHSETFQCYAEFIISNEPMKHTVKIMTIMDLLQLDSVGKLCPWVAYSFGEIPFMSGPFLEPYLSIYGYQYGR